MNSNPSEALKLVAPVSFSGPADTVTAAEHLDFERRGLAKTIATAPELLL
jgi:hypothetical protein